VAAWTLGALLAVVADVLGYAGATGQDSFIGLGGTSLSALQVQVALGRAGLPRIEVADLLAAEDFGELAALIEAAVTTAAAVDGATAA
jgi:hypothetical protein